MSQEKKETIRITGKSIHTNNISSWNNVEIKLKSPLHVGLDITKRQFLELIGDVTAENIILNNPLIEERDVLAKIRKFLTWKSNKKLPGKSPKEEKKIYDELNEQLVITKSEKFTIIGKINNISNIFKKEGLEEKIYEKKGHQFRLLFFSFTGPEKIKVEKVCPKERIILFGPSDQDIIDFCNKTSFYMNKKRWNSVKDRFFEVVMDKKRISRPIHIIPVEQYLERGLENKPKFFRKVGPRWIDFEKEYIVKRDEVDEIIGNLNQKQFQLLIGDAASGKTTIMASIGYKLVKEKRWNVNILSSKAFNKTTVDNLIGEIDFFNSETEDALIIIEDFHKNAFDIVYILEHMIPKKSRILLVARGSYKINLQQEEIEFLDRFKIRELEKDSFSKIADELIKIYKKKLKGERKKDFVKLNQDHISKFKSVADGNLWILAYLLEAWTPIKLIDMRLVYDRVRKDIDDLEKEFKRSKEKLTGVADALLALAPFSKYEVGVSKSFFNERYGVVKLNPFTLDKLIDYGEIVNENGYYSIPHSTLAELYMKTAMFATNENKELLTNLIKNLNIRDYSRKIEDYPTEMLRAYFHSNPKNYHELTHIFMRIYDDIFNGIAPHFSLKKIFQDDKTIDILVKSMDGESIDYNIHNFLEFLQGICGIVDECYRAKWQGFFVPDSLYLSEKDAADIIEKIGFINQFVEKDPDIDHIEYLLSFLCTIYNSYKTNSKKIFYSLLNKSSISKLGSRIEDITAPQHIIINLKVLLNEIMEEIFQENL